MPNITEISDYSGEYQLQLDNATEVKLEVIRDEWTNTSIYNLLGAELGKLFLADLDVNGVPVTARFTAIYDSFTEDNGSCLVESFGIKEFIKGIVWFYYARNNPVLIATGGNKVNESENSNNSMDNAFIVRNYNKSIATGEAIQWYICDNSGDYPEYNGQILESIIPYF